MGCCDSRVDPAIITQCDPGDLFVIRNVANLVAPHSPDGRAHGVSAALEYAVQVLKVDNIIILGHSKCGGMYIYSDTVKHSCEVNPRLLNSLGLGWLWLMEHGTEHVSISVTDHSQNNAVLVVCAT